MKLFNYNLLLKVLFVSNSRISSKDIRKGEIYFISTTWKKKIFKHYEFLKLFDEASLRSFICDIPKKKFPDLVRMFYSNINYVKGILIS